MTDEIQPYQFLRDLIAEHQPSGWAIEFGVWSGVSLAIIAEHMPVIGLDSFKGLPEDWREEFPKGSFELNGFERPPYMDNAMIVSGAFVHTLPTLIERGMPRLGLVHIDCDLYSSTVTALAGVYNSISVGSIITFDEYHGYEGYQQHEAKAWAEFVTVHGIEAEIIGTGEQERAFRITGIR